MKRYLVLINELFMQVPAFVRRNKGKVWIFFAGLTVISIIGMQKLKIDNSMTANFPDNDPVKILYSKFRSAFGSDEVLYIVYKAKDGNVFSKHSLTALRELQNDLYSAWNNNRKGFNRVTDIISLLNVSYLEGKQDVLLSRDFIETIPEKETDRELLKKRALNHPDYPLLLVSEDARYGGILMRTDFGTREKSKEYITLTGNNFSFAEPGNEDPGNTIYLDELMDNYIPLVDSVREITDREKYARLFSFYYSGNPELMTFLGKVLMKEMGLIIIGSLFLVMLTLWVLFRSWSAVVWPITIVICSVVWTIGTIGWCGLVVSDFINIIVFMLIAIGIADAIHIMSGYLFFRRNGEQHIQAVQSVYNKSGFACFLTSLTTAIGLFAMVFVPIVSMSRFGVFAGIGVIYAFLITVFMLPLMIDLWSPVQKKSAKKTNGRALYKRGNYINRVLIFLEKFSARRSRSIIAVFIIFGLAMAAGFFKININSNLLTIIREDQYIRKAFEVIDRSMAGTGNIEVYVDTGKENGCKDPVVLNCIDNMQKRLLREFPGIVYKSFSLANIVKDSYRAVNEGDNSKYIIPADRKVVSQTLILFDGANAEDRRLFVTDDYRKTRISINTRNIGSREGELFMADVNRMINTVFASAKKVYPGMEIKTTGQLPLLLGMMSSMSRSQLQSFAITFAAISILLLVIFGSLRTGLVSILPNLVPVVVVFGLMGFCGIPLDLHTLLVIPIIIGISVDDTIHFLTHFKMEYSKTGSINDAISNTMREVGQAIVFTSLVLSIGYLIFITAVNKGFAYFGILCSVAVFTATIADLVFLPSILRIVYRVRNNKVSKQGS